MNYRERMRKAVECPQFGNIDYGEWGSLNLVQRKDIKRLLDEMDRADEYIKTLYFKNKNLQSKIDKANEILEEILVVSDWEHKGRFKPVKGTTAQDVYKTIVKLNELLETPRRINYELLKEEK